MRIFPLVITAFLLSGAASRPALAADSGRTTLNAILVIASSERGPSDRRLAAYEANLKRTLRFESFRYVGAGSATVAAGGTGSIALPGNNRLELQADKSDGRPMRVTVRYGNTDVVIPPGKTVILAGRPTGKEGEVSAVIVTAD
jgi:hypothetical protein